MRMQMILLVRGTSVQKSERERRGEWNDLYGFNPMHSCFSMVLDEFTLTCPEDRFNIAMVSSIAVVAQQPIRLYLHTLRTEGITFTIRSTM